MHASSRGAALVDVIFTCGLVAIVAGITIPVVHATRERDAAYMAARYLVDRLHLVRVEALKRNVMVALRIDPTDADRLQTYVDGDGDGVLQRDIDRGIDIPLTSPARLADYFASVSFRIVNDVPAPDDTGTLAAGSDPVRIGASDLLSFSPLGSGSSGTLYLAGKSGPQMAVRVLGATGRVRVMRFDRASGTWRED